MTVWSRISQEFEQKWVFTEASNLAGIKFEPYESLAGDISFALIFANRLAGDSDSYETMLTFNTWNLTKVTLSSARQVLVPPPDQSG